MFKLGILHTGIRQDEKLLQESAKKLKVGVDFIDVRKIILDPSQSYKWEEYDCLLERCISTIRGNAAIDFFSNLDLPIINSKEVVSICNDKFQTASVLNSKGVPHARSVLVFDEEQAKEAVKSFGGYPVVIKSREGSWGRMIAKVNDEDSLEAILDHRKYMNLQHQAILIQEYILKPQRDIRAFVIEDKVICAIYRTSEHWITNTARGGQASDCQVTDDLQNICAKASKAVGSGILAMDVFETDKGFIINETNHTMEFKNSEKPTGVSISSEVIKYCQSKFSK
jgi:[lysine-biosynthesis-protein LysW]--L-2-aminoadipate ligase